MLRKSRGVRLCAHDSGVDLRCVAKDLRVSQGARWRLIDERVVIFVVLYL